MDKRALNKQKLAEEREGQSFTAPSTGSTATVIKYNGWDDVVIRTGSGYEYSVNWARLIEGKFKDPYHPSVCGVGYNGLCSWTVGTKKGRKLMDVWSSMLKRCYAPSAQNRRGYSGCTVDAKWYNFKTFCDWYIKQPLAFTEGSTLDKDLLIQGNRIYSESTCLVIPERVNVFMVGSPTYRGKYPIGVSKVPVHTRERYVGAVSKLETSLTKMSKHFDNPMDAHRFWQTNKHEIALQLADQQSDPRVAQALRERYAPDKDWTNY